MADSTVSATNVPTMPDNADDFDLAGYMVTHLRANTGIVWLVGDETSVYQSAITEAITRIDNDPSAPDRKGKAVTHVICHDKVSGFYRGLPEICLPLNKTNLALRALQCMMASAEELRDQKLKIVEDPASLPFRAEDNIVFVLKDWQSVVGNPEIAQFFRNIVQTNMANSRFCSIKKQTRGHRMLVLITPGNRLTPDLPELRPLIVPLPGHKALQRAIDHTLGDLAARKIIPPLTEQQQTSLLNALRGMTLQTAEDTLGRVVGTKTGIKRDVGITDMQAILDFIEEEKALLIATIPGLKYISKKDLVATRLPGYEPLYDEIDLAMKITPKKQEIHRMSDMSGYALIGLPGTGKSQAVCSTAAQMGRMLLLVNMGELRGGLVGESEHNMRRAIQIGEAMKAILWLDDMDKSGMAAAVDSGVSDGGVGQRMAQMLLTHMAGRHNSIFAMTANRLDKIPQEILRAGRVEIVAYVQTPCHVNRLKIFNMHASYHKVKFDKPNVLKMLAEELTIEWTGAEITALVRKAARLAIAGDTDILDTNWMCDYAKHFTPSAQQEVNRTDSQRIEKMGAQLLKIGRTSEAEPSRDRDKTASTGRGSTL